MNEPVTYQAAPEHGPQLIYTDGQRFIRIDSEIPKGGYFGISRRDAAIISALLELATDVVTDMKIELAKGVSS